MISIESITHAGSFLGIFLVAFIVFAESGLLVGFFLPGDTLLFGAGLAASQGRMSVLLLICAVVLAAIIGDNVGYSIGQKAGQKIFKKKDGILFRQEYLLSSEQFYEKHGGKTIILARFTPVVRTFAPVVAGASNMLRKKFIFFNIIGGLLWGAGMILLGYFVGSRIPGLDKYIEYVIVGVALLSLGLACAHVLKDPKTRRLLSQKIEILLHKLFSRKSKK